MHFKRKENWKDILYHYINKNQDREYELGTHDCVLFASNVILAMTDIDIAKDYRGKYKTKTEYLKLFKNLDVRTLEEITNKELGWSLPISKAQIGDLVLYVDSENIQHLGINLGLCVVIPGVEGLHYIYTKRCKLVWSV